MYSTDSRTSFRDVEHIYNKIVKMRSHNDGVQIITPPLILCGNKSDIAKITVLTEEGRALAKSWNAPFFDTSPKTGHNIELSYKELLYLLVMAERPPKKSCVLF